MKQEPGTEYTKSDILRLKMIGGMCRGSVLDVGCGRGEIKYHLPKGCSYQGMDISPEGDEIRGDVYSYEFISTYDTVLLLEVLEHLESPMKALEIIRHLISPGGKLIISVPNPYNLDQIASVLHNDTNIENPNHISMFGDNEIRSLCKHAGFSRVTKSGFYTKIPGLNWLLPVQSRFGEWSIYEVWP